MHAIARLPPPELEDRKGPINGLMVAGRRTATVDSPRNQDTPMNSTQFADGHTTAAPWIASIPLSPDGNRNALVIVHGGRAISPPEGLKCLLNFNADGQGGWISAAQANDGRWGYIDAEGHWRAPATLENARDFSADGMARFLQDGLWGFVNLAGQMAISPRFEDTQPFFDGLCAVKVGEHAWRIIDREGSFTCDESFHDLSTFGACGLACATVWDRGRNRRLQGFVDREGHWVIEPRFEQALPFEELPVTAASLEGDAWGLINSRGQWVLEPCYPDIRAFNSDGLAYFEAQGGVCGYLDAKGRVSIKGESDLSKHMVCGMVRNSSGTGYLCADGTAQPTVPLAYGSHFETESRVAVVRTATRGDDARPATWGLLHTDGRLCAVGDPLLEPLTNGEGWLLGEQPHTPLVPFLTHDGRVAWIDKEGATVWHATYDGRHATLLDANGKVLWRSSAQENCRAPRPFFHPPISEHLEGITALEDVVVAAQALLADAEARLHRLAAGETLERGSASEDDDEDEGEDDDTMQVRRAVVRRRVMRIYVGEEHNEHYEFLAPQRAGVVKQVHEAMLQVLTTQYGKRDPDPELASSRWRPQSVWTPSWAVPMACALPGDSGVLHESREQWLNLRRSHDTGHGDAWWELWLTVEPSLDALETVQRARRSLASSGKEAKGIREEREDRNTAPDGRPEPHTREEWLQALGSNGHAIVLVPAQWLDDAAVDAALCHAIEALSDVPAPFQTAARLEALIRRGAREAARIPPECMTADGLALARQLYAGQYDWDSRDEQNSRVPTVWNHNSLYDVWGGLLTPQGTLQAVCAHAPLRSVPHWLRDDAVLDAALQADLGNIRYIDKAKITPALAELAVRHDGSLIEAIPPDLLTPKLCLMAVRKNGLALKLIPEPLRSAKVCVAALKDSWSEFMQVPEALRLAVTTQLVEDDLSRARKKGDARESSFWHQHRAWAKLWAGDYTGAIIDAQRGSDGQDAHYVLASAYRALGREREAALEASKVLSFGAPYIAQWNRTENTRWLQALVQGQATLACAVDDVALVEKLCSHPRALRDIPRERMTHVMVDAALAADERVVRFVPRRLMTPARYAIALRRKVKQFEQIPPDMLSEEACIEHVSGGGWRLEQLPEPLRTLSVCAHAVRQSSRAMEHVPEMLRDQVPEAIRQLPFEDG